jgi:hypothetical protein
MAAAAPFWSMIALMCRDEHRAERFRHPQLKNTSFEKLGNKT